MSRTNPTMLPEAAKALLDAPEFATVATLQPDGPPQMSVVWVTRDDDDILFSTLRGREEATNLARDPRATLLAYAQANPYSYLEVRAVAELLDDPDAELIHQLSRKYLGTDYPYTQPGDERVIVRLRPVTAVWRS